MFDSLRHSRGEKGEGEEKQKDLGQQCRQRNDTSMVVRLRISASLVISNFLFRGVLNVDFSNELSEVDTRLCVLVFF